MFIKLSSGSHATVLVGSLHCHNLSRGNIILEYGYHM